MEDLDPQLRAQMEKFGITMDALTAILKANSSASKSATLEALNQIKAQKQLIESIKSSLGMSDKQALQMAKQIKLEEKQSEELKKRLDAEKEQDEARKKAGQQAVKDLLSFAKQNVSATQSVYNSNEAFTAVIPTLQLVGTAFKAISQAIAGAATGIPFIGGLSEGASKVIGAAIDIATAVTQAQVENAQKYVNTYAALSKVGITFGGAVEQMRQSAMNGGLSLDAYSKFITSNIQNLSLLGGTTEEGAARITKMGKIIADGNPKLLSMYGSYEDLQGATSDYVAMMARYGIDINKTDKDLNAGAKEYLFNMKELSALTGKSADELKKAEEERAKSAAYDLALSRMSVSEAQNSRNAIELTAKNYGDVAAKYAQEYIATNGNVTSEAALQFKAMYPEISKTVDLTLGATKQTTAEFQKSSAEIIQGRIEQNRKEVEDREHLYKLQAGGVQGPMLEMANNVGAAFLKNISAAGDMVKSVADLQAARDKETTAGTTANANAIKALNDFKMKIDEQTEKTLPQVGEMVTALFKVQTEMNKLGEKFVSSIDSVVIPALGRLASALDEASGGKTPKPKSAPAPGAPVTGSDVDKKAANGPVVLQRKDGTKFNPFAQNQPGSGPISGGSGPNANAPVNLDEIVDFGNNTGDRTHFDQLDERVKSQFVAMAQAYNKATNKKLKINSAFRSEKEQKEVLSGSNPKAQPGHSLHQFGKAIDINSNQVSELVASGLLKDFGFSTINGDAPHIQMLGKGGVTDGVSIAGEAGPEAVVPLPDGRSIPVKMDVAELVQKLDELLTVMKDQRDNSEKLLWANS